MKIEILIDSLPIEGTVYQAGDGLIIHIPNIAPKTSEELGMLPQFSALFRPVSSGFIEVGEWDGKAYEFEDGVELLQGPDGKVWTQVCEFSNRPIRRTAGRDDWLPSMSGQRHCSRRG
jgi:hypothetical protein